MKTIKFRAWSKETKKIYEWSYIQKVGNLNKLISLEHIILMQFTGMIDKNSVEIYEGYICHCRGAYYEVKRHVNGIYELHLLNYNEFPKIRKVNILEQYLEQVEVIGNIYEHPHLLEVNHD